MPGQNQQGNQAEPQAAATQAAAQQDPNGAAAQQQPAAGTAPAAQPNGGDGDVEHWKQMSRMWEERSKANESAASQANAALAEANRQIAVMQTAEAAGVSADILGKMSGTTPEEIAANAALLAQAMAPAAQQDPNGAAAQQQSPTPAAQPPAATQPNPYPDVPDFGASAAHGTTKDEIEKIKDPTARVMARAGNVVLYK